MPIPDCRIPGPGDEATWSAYAGHPNDPRAPAEPEWEDMTREERLADLAEYITEAELREMYLDECDRTDRLLAKLARHGISER